MNAKYWLLIGTTFLICCVAGASCPPEDNTAVDDPTGSGGQTTADGGLPTTSQPASETGPEFKASLLDPLFESTAGAAAIVIGDLDNDGTNDAASISRESQTVQIHMRNTTTNQFETFVVAGGAPLSDCTHIALTDLDQNGSLDIVVLVPDTGFAPPQGVDKVGALVILLQGAETRDPFEWTLVTLDFFDNNETSLTDLKVADIDEDNAPDIIFLSNEVVPGDGVPDSFAYIYFNPGAASVEQADQWVRISTNSELVDYASVAVNDIDGDGDLDVVCGVPQAASFNVRWMQNPLLEQGAGAARTGPWAMRFVGQQAGGADHVALGDIDGDGDTDVAASHVEQKLTQWFRNPGSTVLQQQNSNLPWEVFNIGSVEEGDINQLALIDLDGDGTILAFVTAAGVAWAFEPQDNIEDYWVPGPVFKTDPVAEIGLVGLDDFNGDGWLDFIAPLNREGLIQDQFIIFTRVPPTQ